MSEYPFYVQIYRARGIISSEDGKGEQIEAGKLKTNLHKDKRQDKN